MLRSEAKAAELPNVSNNHLLTGASAHASFATCIQMQPGCVQEPRKLAGRCNAACAQLDVHTDDSFDLSKAMPKACSHRRDKNRV